MKSLISQTIIGFAFFILMLVFFMFENTHNAEVSLRKQFKTEHHYGKLSLIKDWHDNLRTTFPFRLFVGSRPELVIGDTQTINTK